MTGKWGFREITRQGGDEPQNGLPESFAEIQLRKDFRILRKELSWWSSGLRLCAPNAGGLGSVPGQGTRSHMPQLKILHAANEDLLCCT